MLGAWRALQLMMPALRQRAAAVTAAKPITAKPAAAADGAH
jgi:hypothetical protein